MKAKNPANPETDFIFGEKEHKAKPAAVAPRRDHGCRSAGDRDLYREMCLQQEASRNPG